MKNKKEQDQNNEPKKLTPAKQIVKDFLDRQDKTTETYFKKIPKNKDLSKYICSCCGKELNSKDGFWRNYSYSNASRKNEEGYLVASVCKECAQKLFNFYYEQNGKNLENAIERTCVDLNVYWDIEVLKEAKRIHEHNARQMNIFQEYVAAVGRRRTEALGLTYWSSPIVQQREDVKITDVQEQKDDKAAEFIKHGEEKLGWDTPQTWEREDAENRKRIIRLYRYDPFEFEDETEQPVLYSDLNSMIEEEMEDDLVKLKAALEIVRSFARIERLRKKSRVLERRKDTPQSEIKQITDAIKIELKNITDFSNSNGFSERYGKNKAKGLGSLSGIMKEMSEKRYESSVLNVYNSETSESINQAAEASMKAILSQLPIGANEQYTIIQNQRNKLTSLEKENKKLMEDIRKLNIEVERMKLEKQRAKAEMGYDIRD